MYCVYKNNMRDGVQFVKALPTLSGALMCKANLEWGNGGCCDVVKKRIDPTTQKPINPYIGDNKKYSEYDLDD